jgi:hypothetical protein
VKITVSLTIVLLSTAACSGGRLPPGTPPPEYEPPIVTPWPETGADAGSDAAAQGGAKTQGGADASSLAPADPELSLDAGPR